MVTYCVLTQLLQYRYIILKLKSLLLDLYKSDRYNLKAFRGRISPFTN